MVFVCAAIHALGLGGISKLFRAEDEELERKHFDSTTFWLIIVIALALFLLHVSEIWLFALLYRLVHAIGSFENALYVSASAYTTAGNGIEQLAREWRLVGASEALAGFLLLGWSTAYLVQKLQKLRE